MAEQHDETAGPAASPETALILAGGFGTRLRPALTDKPKVLAPVGERPFIAYLLDQLQGLGLRRVVLCTGFLGDQVEEALGPRWGELEVLFSREDRPLGTGGAISHGARQVPGSSLLVLNGDSYCQADLAAFLRWCRDRASRAAMVLTRVPDSSRYGTVGLDSFHRVEAFTEKGSGGGPGLINAGIYLLHRRLVETMPPQRPLSLEREVLPGWVGRELHGWTGGREFIDIGTPTSLARATSFFGQEVPR